MARGCPQMWQDLLQAGSVTGSQPPWSLCQGYPNFPSLPQSPGLSCTPTVLGVHQPGAGPLWGWSTSACECACIHECTRMPGHPWSILDPCPSVEFGVVYWELCGTKSQDPRPARPLCSPTYASSAHTAQGQWAGSAHVLPNFRWGIVGGFCPFMQPQSFPGQFPALCQVQVTFARMPEGRAGQGLRATWAAGC